MGFWNANRIYVVGNHFLNCSFQSIIVIIIIQQLIFLFIFFSVNFKKQFNSFIDNVEWWYLKNNFHNLKYSEQRYFILL